MKKFFKILFFIIIISVAILWLVKIFFLTHKYQIKNYNEDKIEKDIVITFNGIYGYEKQLRFINEKLAEEGYTVVNIQYPTVNDNIVEMTEKYIVPNIEEQVKKLEKINLERRAKNLPELKLNFVVHSMGTCLLRYYLKENKLDNLGKVVLITPPSHGSQLSDNPIADLIPYFIGPAVKDMKTNKNSFVNQLGNPDYPCYILIADSDDSLPEDSLSIIHSQYLKIKNDSSIGGVCGLMAHHDGTVIGYRNVSSAKNISSIEMRYKYGFVGDVCEVFKTEVLREYPFPEINNEKFCPEQLVWFRIAQKYKLRYFNTPIYVAEYQPNGITASIIRVRMLAPQATCMMYAEMLAYKIPFKEKIKAAINFWRFKACAPSRVMITALKGGWRWCYLIGMLLHWRDKKQVGEASLLK